jgi:hypothetical protein
MPPGNVQSSGMQEGQQLVPLRGPLWWLSGQRHVFGPLQAEMGSQEAQHSPRLVTSSSLAGHIRGGGHERIVFESSPPLHESSTHGFCLSWTVSPFAMKGPGGLLHPLATHTPQHEASSEQRPHDAGHAACRGASLLQSLLKTWGV